MIWKKSGFSYLIWLLYTALAGIGLTGCLAGYCSQAGYPRWTGFAISAGIMLVGMLLSFLFESERMIHFLERLGEALPVSWIEMFLVLALLAVGVALRVWMLPHAQTQSDYYELAKLTDGLELTPLVHGIEDLYLRLLRLVLFVVGNKMAAACILQIVLQFAGSLVFFFAVRRLAGRLPAFGTVIFFAFSPFFLTESLKLSPGMLFFLLYSAVLAILSYVLMSDGRKPAGWLLGGILTGLMIYLDVMSLTLLLFLTGSFFLQPAEGGQRRISEKAGSFCLGFFGAVLGTLGALIVDSFVSGKSIERIILAVVSLYRPEGFVLSTLSPVTEMLPELLVLFGLMSIGIFSNRCNLRTDGRVIWVLSAWTLILAGCFGVLAQDMDNRLLLYPIMAVLAGLGLQDLGGGLSGEQNEKTVEEQLEELFTDEKETEEIMENGEIVTVNVEGETRQVRLLENPLPLPKKRAHKAMDYDVDVAEDDDFDI